MTQKLKISIKEPVYGVCTGYIKKIVSYTVRPATELEIRAWHYREIGGCIRSNGIDVLEGKEVIFEVTEE